MKKDIKLITRIALIAALYVVITIIFAPISYGHIQVRISEALTLLPFFLGYPAAIALWIGCMIANVYGGLGLIDIIFGALITLAAGIFTARARSLYRGAVYPVVFNAFGVGFILYYLLDLEFVIFGYDLTYFVHVFYVGLGQFISVYLIGIPLMKLLHKKLNLAKWRMSGK